MLLMDKSTINGHFQCRKLYHSRVAFKSRIQIGHPHENLRFEIPIRWTKKRHLDSKAMEMDPTTDLPRSLADGLQTLAKVPLRRGLEALRLECSDSVVWIYIYMDERNPAPVDIYIYIYIYIYMCIEFTPLIIAFQPSKVVQDFFHPHYLCLDC